MTNDDAKKVSKQSLPFILSSIICGYSTDLVPRFIPEGDLQNWAYRSIPCLAICLMFIFRTIKDVGSMSISQIAFTKFCSSPEKKRLIAIINDKYASAENIEVAKKRYSDITQAEISMNARMVDYVTKWKFMHRQKSEPTVQSNGQAD
ncbi:hypothetical protein [Raoultella ornithinolytica]|uniref:hypothetical protein n=1 Tax=Raoultella ornithinolytica TaxID=54291 RepID=UPI0012D3C09A